MICPKCKTEQSGNYCSDCGEKLRERCAECGKMGPIGQSACKTRLRVIKASRNRFVRQGSAWFNLAALSGAVAIIVFCFSAFSPISDITSMDQVKGREIQIILTNIALSLAYFVFVRLIMKRRELYFAKRRNIFADKFPIDTEILRKAEGENNVV
jgi:hypothetical protein